LFVISITSIYIKLLLRLVFLRFSIRKARKAEATDSSKVQIYSRFIPNI
jgi:hypothetical protein